MDGCFGVGSRGNARSRKVDIKTRCSTGVPGGTFLYLHSRVGIKGLLDSRGCRDLTCLGGQPSSPLALGSLGCSRLLGENYLIGEPWAS